MNENINSKDENQLTTVMPWGSGGVLLGEASDSQSAMKQSGLDWVVSGQPILTTLGGDETLSRLQKIDKYKAVVRSTDDEVLGIVGHKWNILQNHEVFKFIDELQDLGMVKYHSAGSFKNGKIIWVQAEFEEVEILPGDVHKKYLLFANAFDNIFSIKIGATDIRVACYNALVMAAMEASKNGFKISHTSSMRKKLEKAKDALMRSRDISRQFDAFQRALLRLHMDSEMMKEFSESIIPVPATGKRTTRSDNARAELVNLVNNGKGQNIEGVLGTGYAALNGLTEYAGYSRSSRGKSDNDRQSKRFESILFGSGGQLINTGISLLNDFLVRKSIQVDIVS